MDSAHQRDRGRRLMSWRATATLILIACGALAFGAVYSWAYVPLFVGCAVVGIAAAWQRPAGGGANRPMALALAGVIAAIALQLMPVSIGTIRRVSPATDVFLAHY